MERRRDIVIFDRLSVVANITQPTIIAPHIITATIVPLYTP
jgi:hypothetical protein